MLLRAFELFEFREDGLGDGHEFFPVAFVDRLGVGKRYGTWIAMHAIQAIFVVQVIRGSETGTANEANCLAPRKITLPSPEALIGVPLGAA